MLVHLFGKIVSMSLIGCYMIGVVLLVRLLLHKCERKYAYFLWLVVFVNLCLPISIDAPFSLIPDKIISVADAVRHSKELSDAKSADNEAVTDNTYASLGQGKENNTSQSKDEAYLAYLEALGMNPEEFPVHTENEGQKKQDTNTVNSAILSDAENAEVLPENDREQKSGQDEVEEQPTVHVVLSEISLAEILGGVWSIVVVIIGGFGVVQLLRLNKKVKCSVKVNDVEDGVACIEGIESPFLWGILHPIIYLPPNIEESEREYIVAHERFHKKRGDHIVKLLVFAVVAIHWFNPFVWTAYVFFIRDMEISCDEAVLSHAEKNINKQYANSLLKYAAKQNGFLLTPLTFGEPSLKSRIHNVLQFKKRGMAVTVIAVCVVALTACGFVLRPQEESMTPGKEQEGIEQSGSDTTKGKKQDTSGVAGEAQSESQKGEEVQGEATQEEAGMKEDNKVPAQEKGTEYTKREVELAMQFQSVLGVEDANFVETVLQNRDAGLAHIFDDDFSEHYYSYHANLNTSEENGFRCEIRWMKLADSVVLQDWYISLQKELEGLTKNASLVGVFYEEEQNRVFIPISSIEAPAMSSVGLPDTWVLTFPIDNPNNNQLYAYDGAEGTWFGEPLKLDNCLYLHGGAGDVPYEINIETMEGRRCEEEFVAAKDVAAVFIEDYEEKNGVELAVHWFHTVARYKDITLFTGQIAEAMDFPAVATVYLAMQDGEVVASRIVAAEDGEISYGFITERDKFQQLEEGKILGSIIYADAETIIIDEKRWITWQDEEWKDEYDAPNGYMVLDVSNALLECPIAKSCTIAVLDEQYSASLEEYSYATNYEAAFDRANNLFHVEIIDGEVVSLWEQYEP